MTPKNTHSFRHFQFFFLVSGHRLRDIDILTALWGGYIYMTGDNEGLYNDWGR